MVFKVLDVIKNVIVFESEHDFECMGYVFDNETEERVLRILDEDNKETPWQVSKYNG